MFKMKIQFTKSKICNLKSKIVNLLSTFFKANSSGYSLYLVLVVLVVAGVLFSITLKTSLTAHVFSVRHVQSLQAKLLAHSGIARAEYFLNGGDGHDLYWKTDNFEEKIEDFGNISLSCIRFGAFARVISTGKRLKKECTFRGLLARDVPQNIKPAITLTGHVGGLVLDRNTSLEGKVVIHHGEVRRGKRRDRIPGSDKWTIIRESPPLPFDIEILKSVFDDLNKQLLSSPSSPEAIKGNYSINNANDSILLQEKIVVIGDCSIGKVKLNNLTLISSGTITLENGAECNDVTFISNKLTISGGVTDRCLFFTKDIQHIKSGYHKSQFFSSDSIKIEKDATFSESNIWVCHRKLTSDTTITGGIYFPYGSKISGHCICFSDTTEKGSVPYAGPSIIIGRNSSYTGCIVTDGDIDINSVKFKGHIWARSLTTKESDILYKNWIINCSVSPLDKDVSFPLLGDLPAKVSLLDVGS